MNADMDPTETQRANLEVMLKQAFAGWVFKFWAALCLYISGTYMFWVCAA